MTPQEHKAALAVIFFGRRQGLFKTTGNPVHAWLTYRMARHYHVPIPEWVLAYLDGCAKQLTAPGASTAERCAKALRFVTKRGGRSASKRADTEERNLAIVDMVLSFQDDGMIDDLAFGEVAERFGLSSPTVKNIYYELTVTKKRRRRA